MKKGNNIIQDWLDKHGDPEIDKKVEMKLEQINKERYNQIIDDVYGNYISYIHDIVQGEHQIYGNWYGKKEFIDKCKTDPEFSEKWGLKIEEKELSLDERIVYALSKDDFRFTDAIINEEDYEKFGIPTKLITLTYNNETIEFYEELEYIDYEGYRYWYEHKLAKDRVDICLATKDPQKYCNGFYLYSTKDPGSGKAFVVVKHNNPNDNWMDN